MVSERKIWKSFQNNLFHLYWKNEDNDLGRKTYPFLGKHWAFLGVFQSRGKNVVTKNMVRTSAFQENYKNLS